MAIRHFAAEDVAVATLEVGMGGQYDVTSAVDPVAGAVTSVAPVTRRPGVAMAGLAILVGYVRLQAPRLPMHEGLPRDIATELAEEAGARWKRWR